MFGELLLGLHKKALSGAVSQQKLGITEGAEYKFVTACWVYMVVGTRHGTLYQLSPIFPIFISLCF